MKIKTNNIPRELLPLESVPNKVQPDFDYLKGDDRLSYRFVQYKGWWYDVYDTQAIRRWGKPELTGDIRVNEDDPLAGWDSVSGDSFFSGVLFKLTGDEGVICGRYTT